MALLQSDGGAKIYVYAPWRTALLYLNLCADLETQRSETVCIVLFFVIYVCALGF